MDRLDAIAAFVAVAEGRGFAIAARRLRLSPSMVTRLVAGLEEHLSVRLLHRTTRSVALTDAGARYLERARGILDDLGEADAAARALTAVPSGRLVVAAPSVFGRLEVEPLLSDYLDRHPGVSGELRLADRPVNLVEEGVDVALRIGHLDDSGLRARTVGATRRVLVASPAYLARRGRPRRIDDLAAHTTIQFTALTPLAEWSFVVDGRDRRVPIRPALATNSADAAVARAERGGGIAMVLSYQARDAIRAGRLEVLLARREPPPIPIQLVHAAARLPSAGVRAFIELAVSTRRWSFVDLRT